MGWNYRLMRHEEDGEIVYAVHEVHYDSDGKIHSWTEEPASVLSDDRGGVLLILAKMADAYAQPVLDGQTGTIIEDELVVSDEFVSAMKKVKDELDELESDITKYTPKGRG